MLPRHQNNLKLIYFHDLIDPFRTPRQAGRQNHAPGCAIGRFSLSQSLHRLSATDIRIASWNIANLHHQANVEAAPGDRHQADVRRFRNPESISRRSFGRDEKPADIIALQEIGTQQGAERIFPAQQYTVVMSKQFHRDVAASQANDIYTGVAIRKNRGITIVRQEDIEGLAVMHQGNLTRSGAALLLDIAGTKLWFVSVHLKSSCSHIQGANTSSDSDCLAFWS